MNNSYNYSDFVGMNLTSDDEFESHSYQQELQTATDSNDAVFDEQIQSMLLNHTKYYIYCE